jgi:hypothetical protein
MKAMILPADAANAENGKLSILGGFWTSATEGPIRMDVALSIRLLPSEMGRHQLRVTLEKVSDEPGEPVFAVDGELNVEAPEQEMPSIPMAANQVIRLAPMALVAGVYALRLFVNNELMDEWAVVVAPSS